MVIPRATYADYLARQYLSGSKTGRLPLVSSVGAVKSLYGLRQHIEFYGNRMYQPGDSIKNIDWKHSVKYNELVSPEFFEVQGQPMIMLVNLVAGSVDESDKLAYNIIAAALSLAQDGIPTAIAAYDDQASGPVHPVPRVAGTDGAGAGGSQGNSPAGKHCQIAWPAGRRKVARQHPPAGSSGKPTGCGAAGVAADRTEESKPQCPVQPLYRSTE